jgi:pyruvate/2-oxoglutarate dehydrogenase complex dihydrolipoamide dehydrogenase (E3) component
MSAHYDVIVLGAGSSGYGAAIRAAQLGSPAVRTTDSRKPCP